jgi:hypothetical protein
MPENYDVQQVCENGHQITDCYNLNPEKRKKFCQDCGAPTLTACPSCGKDIEGALHKSVTMTPSVLEARSNLRVGSQKTTISIPAVVPNHCKNCGEPYPWTKKIQAAIQCMIKYDKLNDEEKKSISQDIKNINKDIHEAEQSAWRIKRLWEKYGPIAKELILEFASRTAAKVFKGQYP